MSAVCGAIVERWSEGRARAESSEKLIYEKSEYYLTHSTYILIYTYIYFVLRNIIIIHTHNIRILTSIQYYVILYRAVCIYRMIHLTRNALIWLAKKLLTFLKIFFYIISRLCYSYCF